MAIWDFAVCSDRSKVRTSICKYIVRFYGHTNEVKGQLPCYLDAYEQLVLIGFRFIWSVRPCPLTFPLAWQAARPSCCCYTQASWSVATGHIKNQGCRTRQAGRKKEESVAMPMQKTEKSPQLFRLPLKASEWSESDLLLKMKHSLQSTSLR